MKNIIFWTFAILLFYFSADIIAKGQTLNEVGPYPILGWLLWGSLAFAVLHWFIIPILQFATLKRPRQLTPQNQAKHALKHLRSLPKEQKSDEVNALIGEIESYLKRDMEQELQQALDKYKQYHDLRNKRANAIIREHCKLAIMGTIINRNALIDGIIMLVLQTKMVVALARCYGYKPSPVFNALCFGWIIANSLTSYLLQDAADAISESAQEMYSELAIEESCGIGLKSIPFVGKFLSFLAEGILVGTTVCATGFIFRKQLQKDIPNTTNKERIQNFKAARREGRKEAIIAISSCVPKKMKQYLTKYFSNEGDAKDIKPREEDMKDTMEFNSPPEAA